MKKKQLFENFITQNVDYAYRFAYSYTKNQQDAEDVVTESIIKALKSINSLKNDKMIKTWFYRIIINTALTQLKREKKIIYMDEGLPDKYDVIFDDYSNINFEQIIEKLDSQYKSIIVLRFFEGMKISEIAEVLQINENTVKTRLYKALKMLKMDLGGLEND